MLNISRMWLALTLLTLVPLGHAKDDFKIRFAESPGKVSITVAERPLATYYYQDTITTRPYFAHVYTPAGIQVTRSHPPDPKELQDHGPMHPGIWLAFGDLSGHDSWRLKAKIAHRGFLERPHITEDTGRFTVQNEYLSEDEHALICTETCRYTFANLPAGWLIITESSFKSDNNDFYFGDQEEMGLGIRLPSAIREDGGNGRILNSRGLTTADKTWGQPAAWCDYSGTIDDTVVGVTLMASPHNARESWWHNRGYGFFACNLFGRQAMQQGPPSKLLVKRGEVFHLGYAILLHSSPHGKTIDHAQAFQAYRTIVNSR
ncbi:MAG: PmoA family protein [Pirellulaceae bacterium]|jgi:hypothetical protein|nr:PmoA family protein [Pirellulaceae bacterium]